MEYHEALNRLERLKRLRPKMGIDTTADLLAALDDPQEDFDAVQIAGSNGKGSTARMLDRILRESDLTVGCYTSPDLNDRRERITVQGHKIPKHEIVRFVETIWPTIVNKSAEGTTPTFFEVFTSLALWYFSRNDVDIAVLEVGIGGRYDATSVVDPLAAAVTNVSLEHTDLLGSTIKEIARDKAQVAPTGAPLVTGATGEALETIRDETTVIQVRNDQDGLETDSDRSVIHGLDEPIPIVQATETEMISSTLSSISLIGPDWEIQSETPLLGQHQAINAGIATVLAKQIADPTSEAIASGIRNVRWPGRFELMDDSPLTILDGAHNPDACANLVSLLERFEYDDLHVVFGALRDKDLKHIARRLSSADRVYLAAPDVQRAEEADTLEITFDRETTADIDRFESVPAALDQALMMASPSDCVLVTGSLSTVSEARDRWTRTFRTVETPTTDHAKAVLQDAAVPNSERLEQSDRIVHRTVRFRVQHGQAVKLQRLMESLGGSCAISGTTVTDQHVEVVLSGTVENFKDFTSQLRGQSIGGRRFATQLLKAVGISANESASKYPWDDRTAVMGILNVTPDSFHDGGQHETVDAAVDRAKEMIDAGANIIDIGGESTRPGAKPISAQTERDRILPVLERLGDVETTLSVDTRKPSVARAALETGADMINDVTGLRDAAMRRVIADYNVPAVLMHSVSAPVNPTRQISYDNVVDDVLDQLTERVLLAERAGIDRSQLIVDPGLGFGKSTRENFVLLDRINEFRALGTPIMIGHSHKSMFKQAAGSDGDRSAPTIAATALAAERGVDVVRVHDVSPNVAAIATATQTSSDS